MRSSARSVALVMSLCLTSPSQATPLMAQQPLDRSQAELALLRARAELGRVGGDYERTRALFARGMAPAAELEARRAALDGARVDVALRTLEVMRAGSRIVVTRAVRVQDSLGILVRVELLRSTTSLPLPERAAVDTDARITRSELPPDQVWVSLKSEPGPAGTVISQPYERVVHMLRGHAVAEFRLLRDVPEIVVSATTGEYVSERKVLFVAAEASEDVELLAPQFAQEADLASQVSFELQLSRASTADEVYRLEVDALPRDVSREFRDPGSGARVNQVRMTSGAQRQTVQLVLALPSRETDSVRVDRAIRFRVSARASRASPSGEHGHGTTALELMPRGIARAELRVANLFHELRSGDSSVIPVSVRNVGSRPLDGLRLYADFPTGWTSAFDTATVRRLDIGGEWRSRFVISPGVAIEPGEYEIVVRLDVADARRRVDVAPVSLRVRVERRADGAIATAVGVLLVAGGASVLALRRMLRR